GGRFHPGGAGTLGALGAAPAEERAHLGAALMEPLSDPGAHAALRNDGNGDAHDRPLRKRMFVAKGSGLAPTLQRPDRPQGGSSAARPTMPANRVKTVGFASLSPLYDARWA